MNPMNLNLKNLIIFFQILRCQTELLNIMQEYAKLGQIRKLYERIDINIYNNLYIIYYITIKLIINFVCYFKIYYAELIMQKE